MKHTNGNIPRERFLLMLKKMNVRLLKHSQTIKNHLRPLKKARSAPLEPHDKKPAPTPEPVRYRPKAEDEVYNLRIEVNNYREEVVPRLHAELIKSEILIQELKDELKLCKKMNKMKRDTNAKSKNK